MLCECLSIVKWLHLIEKLMKTDMIDDFFTTIAIVIQNSQVCVSECTSLVLNVIIDEIKKKKK